METYRIEHYIVNVEINEAYRPGVKATVTIKSEMPNAKYASVYSILMFPDDTPKDLAKRAFIHYKMGTRPDRKDIILRGIIDETMTAEQIRASIKEDEETFKRASATLRKILDEPEPRRPYHLERMIASLNLCSDIAQHRAKLGYQLQQAVQSGQ